MVKNPPFPQPASHRTFRHIKARFLVKFADRGIDPEEITANSKRFRPLGLGYANLGALLMSRGLPYDSNEGRDYAAAITALLCGQAYLPSAEISQEKGPFEGYEENREPMLEVIRKHRAAVNGINANRVPESLLEEA